MPWRIALVGQENQIEDIRFLFSPLTTPPVVAAKTRIQRCLCREVNEIWQCCTGRNLTTFDKDRGTVEEAFRSKVLAAKHTASLQLLRTVGSKLDARSEFERGGGSWSCPRLYRSRYLLLFFLFVGRRGLGHLSLNPPKFVHSVWIRTNQ